jgi:hypothetical protein
MRCAHGQQPMGLEAKKQAYEPRPVGLFFCYRDVSAT